MNLHARLTDPHGYQRQIEKLHQKYLGTRRIYELQQSEVSFASFVLNRATVARKICKTVDRGEYRLAPAHVRTIIAGAKERVVFAYRLTDLLVHGVVAGALEAAIAPRLSPGLYSYRKGASWWTAIAALAAYVRAHRTQQPDVRHRGLYVIRRDIDSYTDSIPVGPTSPLWNMLRSTLCAADGGAVPAADWQLIETVVRPQAFVKEGELFTQYRGVPTGQPISCVLFNLYLAQLDDQLHRVPGAFYARYCDDIIFAHPDPSTVRAADTQIDAALAPLSLQVSEAKRHDLYVTAAGRPSAEWPEAKGTAMIPFLGCLISAQGTVSLNRDKRRRLLADLEDRARRTAKVLRHRNRDAVGRTVCAAINRALQSRLHFSQQHWAALLRRAVTDRHDLKQLDYCIARIVLRAVTGDAGVRAFRTLPYRTLRADWKLISLFHARNRWRRGAAARAAAVATLQRPRAAAVWGYAPAPVPSDLD